MVMRNVNLPLALIPSLIASMVNYYYFELGEDSFILPHPTWYDLEYSVLIKSILKQIIEFNAIQVAVQLENAVWLSIRVP